MARVYAVRYVPWSITTPAGTTSALPQSTAAPVSDETLLEVNLVIPPGHAGQTGIRLDYAGTTVLPWSNPPQFIVGDDYKKDFQVEVEVGVQLRAITYNIDVQPHTHYLLLKMTENPDPARPAFAPLNLNG